MPMFEDSGVSYPNGPAPEYPTFTGPGIEMWNRLQLEQTANEEPKVRQAEDIVAEVFSRLMKIGCDGDNSVTDRIAALEASWRVYADYARFVNGE